MFCDVPHLPGRIEAQLLLSHIHNCTRIPHSLLLPITPPGTSGQIWQLHKQFSLCLDTAWVVTTDIFYSLKATSKTKRNMASLPVLFILFWGSAFLLRHTTNWYYGHYSWERNIHLKDELPARGRRIDLETISEVLILLQAVLCSAPSCMLVQITPPNGYTTMMGRGVILQSLYQVPYPE